MVFEFLVSQNHRFGKVLQKCWWCRYRFVVVALASVLVGVIVSFEHDDDEEEDATPRHPLTSSKVPNPMAEKAPLHKTRDPAPAYSPFQPTS